MGGAAGGDPALPLDDQADPRRDQRAVLRRRTRPRDHERHRDRVRARGVLRPAREHRARVGPRDGEARPGAADEHRDARGADGPPRASLRAARIRPRARVRAGRARPAARARAGDRGAREPQRAARRAGHAARDPQGSRPAAARGGDPRRDLPRARVAHRRRARGTGGVRREARAAVEGAMSSAFSTIRYETAPDLVATITLDRPEALNAFDRQMCEEIRSAWQRIKSDPKGNAVVLRAAGDRAFCAGLDVKKAYGQPDDVWNHQDPGELLSPKWQKVWKPVVCAVQGMCTAGAFYFLNESDIVICSSDATFFDSHVTHGLVCALEPIGLMRRIGLGETLRIALSGNDERVSAETALRIGLVSEIVERDRLWSRAHEIAAAIASKPSAATQGTVRAIWESLDRPYRAAMEQGLLYTRLGNPIGKAQLGQSPPTPRPPRIR